MYFSPAPFPTFPHLIEFIFKSMRMERKKKTASYPRNQRRGLQIQLHLTMLNFKVVKYSAVCKSDTYLSTYT